MVPPTPRTAETTVSTRSRAKDVEALRLCGSATRGFCQGCQMAELHARRQTIPDVPERSSHTNLVTCLTSSFLLPQPRHLPGDDNPISATHPRDEAFSPLLFFPAMNTTSAAQDEFNELIRDKDKEDRHPEDRHHDSDLSEPESPGHDDDYREKIDTDDELDIPADMRANYYMPAMRSEANTGPKGVIADAQAFEQAKKQARRFTWKKNGGGAPAQYNVSAYHDDKALSDDEADEGFMRQWREARLKELQNVGERIRSRTNSPSRRIYGNMPLVDGEGYLDAVDKTASGTTVVVFIYDSQLDVDDHVVQCMRDVARRNDTVRFVKMHGEVAELDAACLPAVLAYKGGDKFASLLPLLGELPADSEVSSVSLETALRK
ncbi:phosducin [Pyrenophora seminiperda CCB06]|uniref:Phosducin n=1 Tax=Pyrenophora seminiperda CCB06 TaxID=1302712 RepID=A0A3M7MA37_9PLEO|nr:phosducin [Pyrenophora seminiperda CCB06]